MVDISLESDIFVEDSVNKFILEIDVLFNTNVTNVIGDYLFGSDFEQFLWSMHDNCSEVTTYCRNLIENNAPSAKYHIWDCNCTFVYDDYGQEFYFLAVAIADPSGSIIKTNYVIHNYNEDGENETVIEKNLIKEE